MITQLGATLRTAQPDDYSRLAHLVHFAAQVHRHLDWRAPLEWIGEQPFVLLENGGELGAALACPVDPPGVAWIRILAVTAELPLQQVWHQLWGEAYHQLSSLGMAVSVAALPLRPWLEALLAQSGFEEAERVVVLRSSASQRPATPLAPNLTIRPMNLDDLPAVSLLDQAAFSPLWQNSLTCLDLAYRQAAIATIADVDGQMAGYQISTATAVGGHLARLAVLPTMQGHGIGAGLLQDLLAQFQRRGFDKITVNTQRNNQASLTLYAKMGFQVTGEELPVYQLDIPAAAW